MAAWLAPFLSCLNHWRRIIPPYAVWGSAAFPDLLTNIRLQIDCQFKQDSEIGYES